MNAITKFFASFWTTIPWTSIGAFNQGITGPDTIQKLVYSYYYSYHRQNTPEKPEREIAVQRFFSYWVPIFFRLFKWQNMFYPAVVPPQ